MSQPSDILAEWQAALREDIRLIVNTGFRPKVLISRLDEAVDGRGASARWHTFRNPCHGESAFLLEHDGTRDTLVCFSDKEIGAREFAKLVAIKEKFRAIIKVDSFFSDTHYHVVLTINEPKR